MKEGIEVNVQPLDVVLSAKERFEVYNFLIDALLWVTGGLDTDKVLGYKLSDNHFKFILANPSYTSLFNGIMHEVLKLLNFDDSEIPFHSREDYKKFKECFLKPYNERLVYLDGLEDKVEYLSMYVDRLLTGTEFDMSLDGTNTKIEDDNDPSTEGSPLSQAIVGVVGCGSSLSDVLALIKLDEDHLKYVEEESNYLRRLEQLEKELEIKPKQGGHKQYHRYRNLHNPRSRF